MKARKLSSKELIDGIQNDVLGLLSVYFALDRCTRLLELIFKHGSRYELTSQFITIDSLKRDLIIRITALDDDSKGNRSFPLLLKAFNQENISISRAKGLKTYKFEYRRAINGFKTKYRNKDIAHINEDATPYSRYLNDKIDFIPYICRAVETLDAFAGRRVGYSLHVGSMEEDVDLRALVFDNVNPACHASVGFLY